MAVNLRTPLLAVAAALSLLLSAQPAGAAQKTIRQTVDSDRNYSSLAALIRTAGMTKDLSGKSRYTLIAPTNKAFKALGSTSRERLAKDRDYARTVLRHHMLKGAVKAANLLALDGKTITPLASDPIGVAVKRGVLLLNTTTKLIKTDIEASNGLIHVSNRVLLPPTE